MLWQCAFAALLALALVRVSSWSGPESLEDCSAALAVLPDRGAVLAGYSLGRETDYEFTVVFFDSAGELRRANRLGSPLNSEDRAWCVAADSLGRVVAAGGTIADRAASWDFFWAAYAPDGETLWTRRLDFLTGREDRLAALAQGPGGDIFLAGRSRPRPDTARTGWDLALVRADESGDTVWTRLLDWGGNEQADALAADRAGNSYVTGRAAGPGAGSTILVASWDREGRKRWTRSIGGRERGSALAGGILLDTEERPVVWGAVQGERTGFDYLVAVLDTCGAVRWQDRRDGEGSVDLALAAAVDAAGNVVVTGSSAGRATSLDILTVKYSPAGETLWTRRWNGPANSDDRGWCVATGPDGSLYVAGTSVGAGGMEELVVLTYDAGGGLAGSYRWEGGEARPVGMAWDRDRLLVAGHGRVADGSRGFLLYAGAQAAPFGFPVVGPGR